MPTWRIRISAQFDVDSDWIEMCPTFKAGRLGDMGDIVAERAALDNFANHGIEHFLSMQVSARPAAVFDTTGTIVRSGTDGELAGTNEFRSATASFTAGDVGRMICVDAPGELAHGQYMITAVNAADSVSVEGVVPTAATGLAFEVCEPDQECRVSLLSVA